MLFDETETLKKQLVSAEGEVAQLKTENESIKSQLKDAKTGSFLPLHHIL